MKTQQNIIVNRTNTILATITGAILLATAPVSANAESWELRMAEQEVMGTRDVEAGRIDKGIRVLEFYLTRARFEEKGPFLTNLCATYTIKRDYETAKVYCDRGVELNSSSEESANNRGVLNAVQGNLNAAMSDFSRAGSENASTQGSSRNAVAQRNIERVRAEIAARGEHGQDQKLSVRVSQ